MSQTFLNYSWPIYVAIIAMGLAGFLHILAVPERYAVQASLGYAFIGFALIQIAWAVCFFYWPSRPLVYIGIAIVAVLLILWAYAHVLPVSITGPGREPMHLIPSIRKLLELVVLVTLMYILHKNK